jgi:hypothetical protein
VVEKYVDRNFSEHICLFEPLCPVLDPDFPLQSEAGFQQGFLHFLAVGVENADVDVVIGGNEVVLPDRAQKGAELQPIGNAGLGESLVEDMQGLGPVLMEIADAAILVVSDIFVPERFYEQPEQFVLVMTGSKQREFYIHMLLLIFDKDRGIAGFRQTALASDSVIG